MYLVYWAVAMCYREDVSFKEVFKKSKLIKVWVIISVIVMVGYLFIKFTGMNVNTLDFLHGASGYYITICAIVSNLVLAVLLTQNKDKLTKTELFSFLFGLGVIIFEII